MSLFIVTFFLSIGCCLYYYLKKRLNYFKDQGIPCAPGWPIFGNMGDAFLRRKHFSESVRDIYNYDPDAKYVGAFDFLNPVYVIRDLDLIKSITIKNFDNFVNHKAFVTVAADPLFGANLFNLAGEKWKEVRSLLSPAFTSSKMKMMFELIVECTRNFNDYLSEQPGETNEMISTKDLFTKYTNDVIATCAFGISVNTLKDPKNKFYILGQNSTNLDGILGIKLFISKAFPRLFRMLRIKIISDEVAEFFKDIVASTIAMREEKGITRPDMIQLMMNARDKENKSSILDITGMTAQAFGFFFGGFDTTSTQMCTIAHELAINPDIQARLQSEIDDAMKETNGKPTYEAINGMPYLDAVFNETVRRHPQASFLDRLCTKAFELPPALPGLKPVMLQPGDYIWIPVSAIHRDPQYFENPEKFDPDRYYQKKVNMKDVQNLGFGIGPRSCIGNRFATLEIKILIFYLLLKFNLKPNARTCTPLRYSKKSFALKPEGGFWLSIVPRN